MKNLSICAVPVILLCMLFYSCTTDPLIPPEDPHIGFDSARYEWSVDTFAMPLKDIAGVDTSQVCILTYNSLLVYNGENYNNHPIATASFRSGALGAVRKDLVYISGGNNISGYYNQPRLLKWDGTSISEINLNFAQNNVQAIGPIYVFSENEIWMGGAGEDIMSFDGFNFDYYHLDSGYQIGPIFKNNGTLYAVGRSSFRDSSGNYFEDNLSIYQFGNNKWENVYSDTMETGSSNEFPYIYFNLIQDNALARYDLGLYEFNGVSFSPVFYDDQMYFISDISGTSLNNFMIIGGVTPDSESALFHWNGHKWSTEIDAQNLSPLFPPFVQRFRSIGDQFYLMGKGILSPYLLYKLKLKKI